MDFIDTYEQVLKNTVTFYILKNIIKVLVCDNDGYNYFLCNFFNTLYV